MTDLAPEIIERGCPGSCQAFFERKIGKFGSYYKCHRCHCHLSEDENGNPSNPVGICDICNGYIFERILPDGTRWQQCWNHHDAPKPQEG